MVKEIKCYGCGAIIQNDDIKKVGYVPKNKKLDENVLCQRCFKLNNYHQLLESPLTDDDFIKILDSIGDTDSLVVYVIDLFDFNGSLVPGLMRHLNYNDLLVVANKRDILPKAINDNKIINWLQHQLKQQGIKPKEIILTSTIKNYNFDALINAIEYYRHHRDVYIVGTTNVGKSSVINKLLKNYSDENRFITTSEYPGTTLNLIAIPLDEKTNLYDTPGIINKHQIAHILPGELLKDFLPQSELRPITYQLDKNQTIYLGALARIDFLSPRNNVTFYVPKALTLHRTKTESADQLYNRRKTLKYHLNQIKSIDDLVYQEFTIGPEKTDIVISGLGFFAINQTKVSIRVYTPKGIGVFTRKALI